MTATAPRRQPSTYSKTQLLAALAYLQQHGHLSASVTLDAAVNEPQQWRLITSTARQHAAAARARRIAQRRAWRVDFKALAAGNND
jgi:hypothetical protein